MIRIILALLTAVILLIFPGLPLLLYMFILKQFNPDLQIRQSFALVKAIFRLLLFICGVKIDFAGQDLIPKDRPVLYVCNHRSIFDILVATQFVPGSTSFVSKIELRKVPLLAQWMNNIRCVFIDRSNPKEALRSINAAIDNIKEGTSVWIFPEGTRNHEDAMLPFKEGSFRIAEKTSCPVVPVAMTGTDDILEKHFPYVHATHVKVKVGEPIYTENLDRAQKKALSGRAHDLIQNTYNEMSLRHVE